MTIRLFLNYGSAWYGLGSSPCKRTTICLLHCSFLVSLFNDIACASIIRILGLETMGICTVRPVDSCFFLCLVTWKGNLILLDLYDVSRDNIFYMNFASGISAVSLISYISHVGIMISTPILPAWIVIIRLS